jgi:MFS family permease
MNEQGELQGVFTSLMSLGEIIGPPLFMWIYYTSRKSMPQTEISYGTPFLAASLFAFLAFILVRWTLKDFVKSSNNPDEKV